MIAYRNRCDSRELDELRFQFSRSYPDLNATAARLGAFAGERQILSTDLGAHSKHWKRTFIQSRQNTLDKVKA